MVLIVRHPGRCGTNPMAVITSEQEGCAASQDSRRSSMRWCHHTQMNSRTEGMKLQNFWDWHGNLIGLLSGQEEPVK